MLGQSKYFKNAIKSSPERQQEDVYMVHARYLMEYTSFYIQIVATYTFYAHKQMYVALVCAPHKDVTCCTCCTCCTCRGRESHRSGSIQNTCMCTILLECGVESLHNDE